MEEETPIPSQPLVPQKQAQLELLKVSINGSAHRDQEEERTGEREESGRDRLKRCRVEMAGRVWIPDIWGQEEFMKDWIDCKAFDGALVRSKIMSARAALIGEEGSRRRLITSSPNSLQKRFN